MSIGIFVLFGMLTLSSSSASEIDHNSDGEISFADQVRPILNKHCSACHGGVKQAADISFSYKDQVVAPEGWIVEPGEPDDSELISRVISEDPDEIMPPAEHGPPLSNEEINVLKQWISEGAHWEPHWAYAKPKSQPVPQIENDEWSRGDIDKFVLDRLREESIFPSAVAKPERWLRRVSLDLTGLPPTDQERAIFLSDVTAQKPDAFRKVVDRLLGSPQFGERWASVWLDQVRYADSKGLGADGRRNIWKYRDWVVDAFNSDMPYDQFTTKQIAGDLLPDRQIDDLIATATHRLTQTNEEGGTDDEEFRVAAVLDRVNTTWQTWQGVTIGCVQCHSHPYDPIRHEEFYEFAAFFNNTKDVDLNEDWPVVKAPVDPSDYGRATDLDRKIQKLRHQIWSKEFSITSDESIWEGLVNMTASTNKPTKVAIESVNGRNEFHTVDTISKNTDITLEAPLPANLDRLTAIRFTASPLNPETAIQDSEWGFVLSHVDAELLVEGVKKPMPIKFSRVLIDEPNPFLNPQESLNPKSNQGFAAYTRIHYPRTAALILDAPMDVPTNSSIRVVLKHRYFILASFSLITRRGHLAVTDSDQFSKLESDDTFADLKKQLSDTKTQRSRIKSTNLPVLLELEENFKRPTHVFTRGLFLTKGEEVAPETPDCFPPLPTDQPANRLALAQWLISKENPLTARVAVNRIWAQLFGTGIVETEEDFGSSGEPPSHPKLLDYLAIKYQGEMQWSTKKLLREIVLSSTYRQSAKTRSELVERDPRNRLLASGPRFRLPSEVVRDQALSISGLLSLKMAGPPVRPPIPDGVWNPFSGGDKWETAKLESGDRYRRSIYTYTKRSIPYPMFAAFDAPSREFCSPRRLRSNTPLQALMTLNDQTFVECAAAFSNRIESSADNLQDQLRNGFVMATCREPNDVELNELLALAKSTESSDGLSVVAAVLLNLDEVLMK